MEERIGERLSSLENNIRGTFANYTDAEIQQCNVSIERALNHLQDELVDNRIAGSSPVVNNIQELKSKLRQIRNMIEDGRHDEANETISNLHQVGIKLDDAIEGLEEFEVSGIRPAGQDDIGFENDVQKLTEDSINEFAEKYRINNPEVMGIMKKQLTRLTEELGRHHGEVSVKMKGQIKDKVECLGEELLAKSKEEKEKGKDDFASKLQGQTVSESELAEKDSQNLSANRLAFKDEPARDDSNRKNLEAMFK